MTYTHASCPCLCTTSTHVLCTCPPQAIHVKLRPIRRRDLPHDGLTLDDFCKRCVHVDCRCMLLLEEACVSRA